MLRLNGFGIEGKIQFKSNQNCCDKNNNDNCRQSSSQSIKLI